jgi:nucleoid DNA-binding protein
MDAKLNHSDFSALLSKHLEISVSKAEHFTKAFFDILIEGLDSDGIVKINGLGTFKMIDVASRGSVNVNTGEKIEIKGHRKLTFIPADTLKDKINQPFAMFEPVEVDDDYVDDADDSVEQEEQTIVLVEQQPVVEEQHTDELAEAVEEPAEEPADAAEQPNEEPKETVEEPAEESADAAEQPNEEPKETIEEPADELTEATEQLAEEPADAAEQPNEEPKETIEEPADESAEATKQQEIEKNERSSKVYIYAAISTLLLIIAVFLFFVFDRKETVEEGKSIAVVAEPDTIKPQIADTLVAQPSIAEDFVIVEAMNSLPLSKITIEDTTIYSIKGTKAVHRVGLDETLTKISLLYFEDKRFWPYIVQYNKIKNYNSLEIGTELLIPNLVPRK